MIEFTPNFCKSKHNRTFGNGSFRNCTQITFHLVSNKPLLSTNKSCVTFNFKHKYTGKMSERAETAKNVTPSVQLTILEESGYNWRLSRVLFRVDLVRLSSIIEPTSLINWTHGKVPIGFDYTNINTKLHLCQRPKTRWTLRVISIIAENKSHAHHKIMCM